MEKSDLQAVRAKYQPQLPDALKGDISIEYGPTTKSVADEEEIKGLFPQTYGLPLVKLQPGSQHRGDVMNFGVILSGGQAPGGHNVICGLFDEIKRINPADKLYGFLMGPGGLVDHEYKELTEDIIDDYRNTGGFDMIGSGRTKLETVEQFEKAHEILVMLGITALVIIGGDDSNTNACVLAEYYKQMNYGITVIGCPKTIDGDLKNKYIESSFGFDSATKTYAELLGNIERDCNSACKYWHFIKVMGRSASHIALEVTLQAHPNICLISEEIQAKDLSLNRIVHNIAKVVQRRAELGMEYGVAVIPEGLIEFIPALGRLIDELDELLVKHGDEYKNLPRGQQREYIQAHLSEEGAENFESLPAEVARQLAFDRDPHGNVQVSLIETDKLIAQMVKERLRKWKAEGLFHGEFRPQHHFFGYEGRCAMPSNYDANYCYSLGVTAAQLALNQLTGYMAVVSNTTDKPSRWQPGGIPLTMLMNMERRNGKDKPVIRKTMVDLDGEPFKEFCRNRERWAEQTCFVYPGPIQYFGPSEICDATTKTLQLEHPVKN